MVHVCRSICLLASRWLIKPSWRILSPLLFEGCRLTLATATFPTDVYFLCTGSTSAEFPLRQTTDSTPWGSPVGASSLEKWRDKVTQNTRTHKLKFVHRVELHIWANRPFLVSGYENKTQFDHHRQWDSRGHCLTQLQRVQDERSTDRDMFIYEISLILCTISSSDTSIVTLQ